MPEDRYLARVTDRVLEEREAARFVATPGAGAVVLFCGIVREKGAEGGEVVAMDYASAGELTRAKLEEIAREALRDRALERVALLQRTGRLRVGEASVIVAASAPHREEAFRGAHALIERLKEVLPVWKREHFADGSSAWVAGRPIPGTEAGATGDSPEVRGC